MMIRTAITASALAIVPLASGALTLDLPAQGRVTVDAVVAGDRTRLPVSPFANGTVETRAFTGQIRRTAWKLSSQGLTTFQILDPLRAQLTANGYDVVFDCADRTCGGFDFRFATDVVPAPAMYVDLGDFRYLLAERGKDDAIALMVSRAPGAGFVQMTEVTPQDSEAVRVVTSSKSMDPLATVAEGDLADALRNTGAAPLDDLLFDTGSSDLSDGDFTSLRDLADYLRDTPATVVTLVGHTDDEGGLAGNIALSKRRAQSVRQRLIRDYEVPADRLRAEGVGFLAPRAANTSDEGRLANRRVEAIVTR
ncbi:OmpA family protein [Oceaniglobus indicus]|uniref:OmpA family protein n=1 Tax=Oceaniglobus indicus TaxID=2047749 RepID=UPI000C1A5DC9|nr:OmpA family protein [Oceaniglobus indicus]